MQSNSLYESAIFVYCQIHAILLISANLDEKKRSCRSIQHCSRWMNMMKEKLVQMVSDTDLVLRCATEARLHHSQAFCVILVGNWSLFRDTSSDINRRRPLFQPHSRTHWLHRDACWHGHIRWCKACRHISKIFALFACFKLKQNFDSENPFLVDLWKQIWDIPFQRTTTLFASVMYNLVRGG